LTGGFADRQADASFSNRAFIEIRYRGPNPSGSRKKA
jgi:hypothetical protein